MPHSISPGSGYLSADWAILEDVLSIRINRDYLQIVESLPSLETWEVVLEPLAASDVADGDESSNLDAVEKASAGDAWRY